eukprot:XP_784328.2 PREDICTED: carbonic anhydrase 1 isoform X2 [Strongylocentrotus purpuratus]
MNAYILLSLATLTLLYQECLGANWHYHQHGPLGPENWPTIPGSHCGGRKQSPINIESRSVIQADLGEFVFEGLQTTYGTQVGAGGNQPGQGGGQGGQGGSGFNWGGAGAGGGGGGGVGGVGGGGGWNWNSWWNGNGWGGSNGGGQNAVGNQHPQWSNPFGNLQMGPKPTVNPYQPFGMNGPERMFTTDNNQNAYAPRALHGYNSAPTTKVEVSNDGHTLKVSTEGMYVLKGGGLPFDAKPAQLHFHWGTTPERGSEHTIDGRPFSAELHLVHYNAKYRTIAEAVKQPDGLAVLGFFIQASDIDNPAYDAILDYTAGVRRKDTKVEYYAHLPLRDMLPTDLSCFYRYNGSLTVPKCWESVTWSVGCGVIHLSHNQLDMFRELYQGFFMEPNGQLEMLHIEDNFRPVQPLFDRQVIRSGFPSRAGMGYSANNSANLISVNLFLLLSAIMAFVCRSL